MRGLTERMRARNLTSTVRTLPNPRSPSEPVGFQGRLKDSAVPVPGVAVAEGVGREVRVVRAVRVQVEITEGRDLLPGEAKAPQDQELTKETPPLVWVAFLLLCALASSAWLLPSPPFSVAATPQNLAAALTAGAFLAFLTGGRLCLPAAMLWRQGLGGALLIGVPFLLSDQARAVPDIMRVAIFAAAPLGIVMIVAFQQTGTVQGGRFLPAGFAGFAGLLFVLPIRFPDSLHAAQAILLPSLAAASVAIASAWLPASLREVNLRSAVLAVCLPNALLLALYAVLRGSSDPGEILTYNTVGSGAVTLLQIVLLVWLTAVLAPHRLASRFFLAPLITTLEGYLLLHGAPTARIVAGALGAACSAVYLLVADPSEPPSTLALE